MSFRTATISYNAVGWKLSETVWENTSSRTFWAAYDRFGRPGKVTLPDGKITDLTYAGERLVTRKANVNLPLAPNVPATPEDLTPVYVTEYRDGFGRLVGVCEGASATWSGDGCTMDDGLETIYRFDVTSRIDEVCHVSVGGTCGQYRRFNNDGRGFLMGERHPEVGTNGGGWTNYTFDSKGNPLTKDVPGTAAFDTSSTYDKAGRLIFLEETSGGRLLKEFAYGKANVGTNKSKGKLVTAKRHNWVDAVSPLFVLADSDVVVTEHFEYSAPGGRASRRQTRYSVDSTHHAFDASWTWDNLGNPKTITYPSCLGAGCSASAPSRTVTNTYDKGFLTDVTGFASLTYQGGGMVRTIAHTNGVTTTIARASHGMDRPASISTNAGWSTGNFTYDGVGNISGIGAISYQYDTRSQLTSGGAKTAGGAVRTQTAAYDDLGNLMNLTTNGSSRDFTVGATNNRITNHNIQYDPAGNLTDIRLDGVNYDHTFDALNMMKAYQSSAGHAEVYIYTADDERLAKVDFSGSPIVATWTLRDPGGRVLRVFKQTWGEGWEWERDYVHRGAQVLATVEPDGAGEKVLHMHLDHLGTPRQITGSGGAEVAYHAYYPFGAELTNEAQNEISLKFTGHERDSGGLDYMHARHCGPEIGRFVSVDPKAARNGGSIQWNRYVYAHNNPLGKIDPDGRDAIAVTYQGYRVRVPFAGRRALGHSGITISNSGSTKYYEFGRYPQRPDGQVRYRGPLPDLEIGSNGIPTGESLGNYIKALTQTAGQGRSVDGAYFVNSESQAMQQFVDSRIEDPSLQGDYSLSSNNCATFCEDVLEAGGESLDLSLVNSPGNVIQELQDVADFSFFYNAETGEFSINCAGELCPE